jgi:HEAT repeat protein
MKPVRIGGLIAKRWPVVGGVLLVAALGWAAWQTLRQPREPIYEGETLSYWLSRNAYTPTHFRQSVLSDSNVVPFLVTALTRDAPAIASAYRKGFSNLPEWIERLLPAPSRDYARVRRGAAAYLRELGPVAKPAIPDLIRTLKEHATRDARSCAAMALGGIGKGDSSVTVALIGALKDTNWWVRSDATRALGQIGEGNRSAITALTEAFMDKKSMLQSEAAEALGSIGKGDSNVLTTMLEVLGDTNQYMRKLAASALGRVGEGNKSVIVAVTGALKDKDTEVRTSAVSALASIGKGDSDAAMALSEALKDDDPDVRINAALVLCNIEEGNGGSNLVAVLTEALESGRRHHSGIEISAALGLCKIGEGKGDSGVVTALRAALWAKDADDRTSAARYLSQIGQGDQAVVAGLTKALDDEVPLVRELATNALLKLALNDKVPAIRSQVVFTLGQACQGDKAVVAALTQALSDADGSVRFSAARALFGMGEGKGNSNMVTAFAEALTDDSPRVRQSATNALLRLDPEAAAKAHSRQPKPYGVAAYLGAA